MFDHARRLCMRRSRLLRSPSTLSQKFVKVAAQKVLTFCTLLQANLRHLAEVTAHEGLTFCAFLSQLETTRTILSSHVETACRVRDERGSYILHLASSQLE